MPMLSVRVDDEMAERLDALGNRSEVVRSALEAYVSGGIPEKPADGDAVDFDWAAERAEIERERAALKKEREALEVERASLKTVVVRLKPRPAYVPAKGSERWSGDDEAVLGLLDRPKGERTVEMELGWMGLRTGRALARLLSAGEIVCEGGLYRRVG